MPEKPLRTKELPLRPDLLLHRPAAAAHDGAARCRVPDPSLRPGAGQGRAGRRTRPDAHGDRHSRRLSAARRADAPLSQGEARSASSGTGFDAIDIEAARALGIAVTNTPGATAECVADTAWSLILATVRRTVFQDKYVRAGGWLKGPVPLTDKVNGEALGIVGLGDIGKAIARRAEAFDMRIAYHGREAAGRRAVRYYADPVALARDVKILVVAMPGRQETRGFINAAIIDALGPAGYLVNISRGTCVDEPYLVDALVNRRLAGAGLDVFADEPRIPEALFALDHVVLQPHSGSGTNATRDAMGNILVDESRRIFRRQAAAVAGVAASLARCLRGMAVSAPRDRQRREQFIARAFAMLARDLAGLALVAARDRAQQRPMLGDDRVGASRREAEAHAQRLDQQPAARRARAWPPGLSATRLIA